MLAGIFLVCFGTLFLLDNLGYMHGGTGSYIVPLFLMILGGSMVLKRIGGTKP